jgi:hypothetical protein
MTTKKTGNSKTSTVQALDLSDLDGIVGGATSPAPAAHPHDPSQDQAFLATLGNVAAVVSTAATAVSSGHETAQTAINTVEAAAQAQHISTAAALTDLLGATHGNQTVATALTTGLVNGSSEAELVNLAANGSLHAADVANIVQVATGTLAAYSKDGHSALGMSQNAAIDVIDSKIDATAQTVLTTGQNQLTADENQLALYQYQETSAQSDLQNHNLTRSQHSNAEMELSLAQGALPGTEAAVQSDQATVSNMTTFVSAFESQNASHLAAAQSIIGLEGGATAFQTSLTAATAANPLQEQSAGVFGLTATVADALGGQVNPTLVHQILAASGMVGQLESIAHDGTLSSAGLSALENAAALANVSTDLTLAVAESVAQTSAVQQTLATEMTSRLVSGTAEIELAGRAANGYLQVQDVNTIVSSVTGALAGLSADGHSALGMSQNAAIDVIDSKIDAQAQAQVAGDQHMLRAPNSPGYASSEAALSRATNFANTFESQNASQLTAAQSIINLEGGAAAFQAGLDAVVGNPLQAQNASVFGETATIADAFAGHATSALVNEILAASKATSGAAAIHAIEHVGVAPTSSTDLALALADEFSTNKVVQQALDTELTTRIDNGALQAEVVTLAGQGQLQGGQDVTNIVSTVTGVLASHSADGHTVAGTTQAAANGAIYANIDNQVRTEAANYGNLGDTLLSQWKIPAAIQAYTEGGVLAQFAKALEISHGTDILTSLGADIATKSAQADIQVQAAQQAAAPTSTTTGPVNSIASAINIATSALTSWATTSAKVAAIEQTAQTAIQADLNQARQVIESLGGQAYNAAGGAQTISTVSSSVQTALNATVNAAENAFNTGLNLVSTPGTASDGTVEGQTLANVINSPPTTLAGFVNLGEQVDAHFVASSLTEQVFRGHSSVVLAAEGMDYLLGQSAVANVLGSHATGDLKTACELITSVSNNIQLFASDVAEAGGALTTSVITMQTDLAKNIGSLGGDLFTGNFSDMKGDANHLASQFLTDFKSLGSTIESASSALASQTTTILGNTMNSMYSIISSNPDVEAAVSWVSTTGERIGDVFNDVGGGIENAASSTWNAVSNIGSDFVNGLESGWDTFKSWW